MNAQLPILQVLIPLLAAPLCLMISRTTLVWLFALLTSLLSFGISVILVQHVIENGIILYSLGGWQAPIGIEIRIDFLSVYLLLLITALSSVVLLASKTSVAYEFPAHQQPLFYVIFLLCLAGMLGLIITGDAFNAFIFIEITALSSYALIGMGKDRRALTAALSYLLVGTLGATFILIGIGLMYMTTGTLNMNDLAERISQFSDSRTLLTAFSFFIVGVCLKLALFPLHWWLPKAYAYAPSIVSTFLAATSTKVAIFLLLRFVFSVFGQEFSFSILPLQKILLTLGLVGILTASTMAIYQQNVKQLFAYSSVAQVAYMILTLGFNSETGLVATLLHLFNHALMKGALFLALAAVMYRVGSVQIQHFSGLAKVMPWTMAAVVIGGLSLIGLPLTVGFVSKWHMMLASLENAWYLGASVILFGSLLAAIYIWRIVEASYFKPLPPRFNNIKEAPFSLLVPIWILTFANLYFGINTNLTVSLSNLAAQSLLGGLL